MKVAIGTDHNGPALKEEIINEIDNGMVLLVGFNVNDTLDDLEYIRRKVVNLRIYDDENGVMNKSIIDTKGKILSISQFTLQAMTFRSFPPAAPYPSVQSMSEQYPPDSRPLSAYKPGQH